MDNTNCELWQIGVRIGPSEKGDNQIREGTWDALVERVKLFTMPNGIYEIRSPDRRCVLQKEGNFGDGKRIGTVVIIEDTESQTETIGDDMAEAYGIGDGIRTTRTISQAKGRNKTQMRK